LSTLGQPDPNPTFFVDRTHQGKRFLALLREANISIEAHNIHFAKTLEDHIWIPDVTKRGWVIISGDKRLEGGINRVAVIDSAAKVLILSETNSRSIYWGAAFITGLSAILRCVRENNGPFFVDVNRDASQHVGYPRFMAHGGPIYKRPDAVSTGLVVEQQQKELGSGDSQPTRDDTIQRRLFSEN
jgi:PIN like domain